jgi:hypothetical protein
MVLCKQKKAGQGKITTNEKKVGCIVARLGNIIACKGYFISRG